VGGENNAKDLDEEAAFSLEKGQSWRPAYELKLRMADLDLIQYHSRGCLKGSAEGIHDDNIYFILPS
jgi:hypothetical protein